ncbi:hypothetical protein FXO37_05083 [Capsicum annuum]|nr:hypothetical protein FXO37_05083 [Capsicum annuum]
MLSSAKKFLLQDGRMMIRGTFMFRCWRKSTEEFTTDEVPSFSLGLTQDEVFNLGSTNIFSKEGVTKELRSKHRNDPEKIMEIMKSKGLTKTSSPTKFQKSVKRKKSDEKGECSKIASPVASDSESEQDKVEEVIHDQIFMARVLPKFAPHIGCHTVNDIENRIKTMLTKSQYKMFCTKSIFGFFMNKKDCVVQAQLGRCIMSLEIRESSTSVIVIRAKGTTLYFTIREFALVTGLNCATNKDKFMFDEECPNRIIDQYFDGESFVQKNNLYAAVSDKIWGNDNDEDALKFANLYFIHAFLISPVDTVLFHASTLIWLRVVATLYECCSNVPRNVASKVDSQILRILNWKINSPRPRYETLMGSMFDDTYDKDPPQRQNQFTIKKKHLGDFSASPVKKKMKPHPEGVDELISKRTPPPGAAKMPFVRTLIHKIIKTKVTLHRNRKDINWPDSKKSIPVQSPAPSSFSSKDEDGVVSKKVFDKFCEKKQAKGSEYDQPPADENVKSTSPHQAATKFVHEFNKNTEGTLVAEEMAGYQSNSMNDVYNEIDGYNEDNDIALITKSVDESIGEAQISKSKLIFSDDVLRSIDFDSITKVNVEVEDEFKHKEGAIEMNVNTPAGHESEVNDMDNSKLDQQYKSAVHIPAGVNVDQHLSDSQNTLPDELLPSLNAYVNLKRSIIVHPSANQAQQMPMHVSRIRRPSRYNESPFTMKFGSADGCTVDCNFMNIVTTVFDVYKLDDATLNAGGKKYHLNKYVSGFRMHATVPWHTADHMFIPVLVKAKHHWVVAVISFNHRCIYVYDSLSAVGHDATVLTEIEKLDCGLYMVTYVECLTFDEAVLCIDFDPDLIRIRYASLLWDYGTRKANAKAQSDDEAPMRPIRITELTEGTEVVDI